MPRYVTIGFGDQEGYDRTDAAVRDEAHAADARLQQSGAIMGRAGSPVQVRNHDGAGVNVTHSRFSTSALPIAGFGIIDAVSLEEAIALASRNPCAVAHGVVEVWPLEQD
ncbi:MAG: YciI family protein [Actinomycetota bacterium]